MRALAALLVFWGSFASGVSCPSFFGEQELDELSTPQLLQLAQKFYPLQVLSKPVGGSLKTLILMGQPYGDNQEEALQVAEQLLLRYRTRALQELPSSLDAFKVALKKPPKDFFEKFHFRWLNPAFFRLSKNSPLTLAAKMTRIPAQGSEESRNFGIDIGLDRVQSISGLSVALARPLVNLAVVLVAANWMVYSWEDYVHPQDFVWHFLTHHLGRGSPYYYWTALIPTVHPMTWAFLIAAGLHDSFVRFQLSGGERWEAHRDQKWYKTLFFIYDRFVLERAEQLTQRLDDLMQADFNQLFVIVDEDLFAPIRKRLTGLHGFAEVQNPDESTALSP